MDDGNCNATNPQHAYDIDDISNLFTDRIWDLIDEMRNA